jgi:predicted anti-sigma-YlaC factor YlaD
VSDATTDLTCRDMVELVTEYLEGTMAAHDRVRFEAHLSVCEGCSHYLEQMRTTIRVTGALGEEAFPAGQLDALMQAFRDWRLG